MAKPRVIISTDIGGSDPDDMQSMAHALLASDQWQIEALISTPTRHGGRTSDIYEALDAYTEDYANLKTWSSDYPTPEYLKSIVYQGNINVAPSAGYSHSTEASQAIVKAAHEAKAAGEPLWVMTWGALTDVAQALHDDPSIMSTVRVLASNGWNWTQDPNAYNYVLDTHAENGLWMIDSKSTHRGIYIDTEGKQINPFDLNKVKDAGALGEYFYKAMPWGVKMGDSWSIAYLTDKADENNPQANSWGGTFVKSGHGPNYWTDDPSSAKSVAGYNGAAHVRQHQESIYNDMYRLFDRADAPNPDGPPESAAPADPDPGEIVDPGPPPPSAPPEGSSSAIATANDHYSLDVGQTLWFNTRYLTHNDKGDGLRVVAIDDVSAAGVNVRWDDTGTTVYKAPAGWQGTDSLNYTVQDAAGNQATAKVFLKVGHGRDPLPGAADPEPPPPPSGSSPAVAAANDHYSLDAGQTLWFNTRYLTHNDEGEGLRVVAIDDVSAAGVNVRWDDTGTTVYRAPDGWQGTDSLNYTVQDAAGSQASAKVFLKVGHGNDPLPGGGTTPSSSAGSVVANDDHYKTGVGDSLWFNTRYLTWNDKGDGLSVISVDGTSKAGATVVSEPQGFAKGTTIYKPLPGWEGIDSLGYTVRDAQGNTDTATVFVQVGTSDLLFV